MKNFEYAEGHTESEVLALLSATPGHTEVIAGGTDLMGLMKKMIVTPERVVNIMEVDSLQTIEPTDPVAGMGRGLRIGAAVTLDDLLEHPYLPAYSSIGHAIRGINSMQLQAQGTIGGEICQRPRCWFYRNGYGLLAADGELSAEGDNRFHAIFGNSGPAKFISSSRIAPALIALGAEVRIIGPGEKDEKVITVESFFRTPQREDQRESVLLPGQLLTHIILPPIAGRTCATYEVRHGEGPEMPLAAAAATLQIEGGVITDAKVVLGQVAPVPWVSQQAADALIGMPVSYETASAAGEMAVIEATPLADNEYKVDLAKVAVKRAILMAAGLETGGF